MSEESCVMEEKSIYGRLYSEESVLEAECNCESSLSENSWLPDGLRRKISENFENVREKQVYPVMDWLKKIRLTCDLYDVGLPAKNQLMLHENPSNEEEERWSSDESEDLNDVERNYYENVTFNDFYDIDSDNLHDISCNETHIPDSDNDNVVISIEEEEEEEKDEEEKEEREKLTPSGFDYSHKNDESPAKNDQVTTLSLIFHQSYLSPNEINMTNPLNNIDNFGCQLKNDNSFDSNNSFELSKIFNCDDDNIALKYCAWYLREGEVSEDSWRVNSELKSINYHEEDKTEDQCLHCGNLQANENNKIENKNSDEEFSSKMIWDERLNDFEDNNSAGGFNEAFNGPEENKYSDFMPLDSATSLDETFDQHCQATTMPVMHWVGEFNNLNALKESSQVTERIQIDKFNIFDGIKENNRKEIVALCLDQSNDAGVCHDKLFEENNIFKEYRRRKDSVSSDIVEWKKKLWRECLEDEEPEEQVRQAVLKNLNN